MYADEKVSGISVNTKQYEEKEQIMSRIHFVILTWNSEKVIGQCLASMMKFREFEVNVCIVDNGSQDRTVDVVEQMIREGIPGHCSIQIIRLLENMGTTISRNIGIKQVITQAGPEDFVCILDSDTEVNEQAMQTLASVLRDDPSNGIVGPKMHSLDGSIQTSGRRIPTVTEKILKVLPSKALQEKGNQMQQMDHTDSLCPVGYLMSACWMMRPTLFDEVGLLDENIFYAPEDVEFCIRVWKKGKRVLYCPQAQILHHWQRLSHKKLLSKHNWEHLKGLGYMYHKHNFLLSNKKIEQLIY